MSMSNPLHDSMFGIPSTSPTIETINGKYEYINNIIGKIKFQVLNDALQ